MNSNSEVASYIYIYQKFYSFCLTRLYITQDLLSSTQHMAQRCYHHIIYPRPVYFSHSLAALSVDHLGLSTNSRSSQCLQTHQTNNICWIQLVDFPRTELNERFIYGYCYESLSSTRGDICTQLRLIRSITGRAGVLQCHWLPPVRGKVWGIDHSTPNCGGPATDLSPT